MFRSLENYNYRLWFIGAIISNTGVWMQTTAQSWLVLTELTAGDAVAVGITIALQYGPPILLVTLTGWAADRFDHRSLLIVTQTLLMVLALMLGILVLTGSAALWHVFTLSGLLGIVNAFDAPARHAIVTDLVGPDLASNAVALNTATFSVARLIGPAIAGLTIVVVGTGWVFVANAATFPAMILAILLMRRHLLLPQPERPQNARLAGGIRAIAGRSDLLVVFGVIFLVCAFAINFPLFGATMAVEFGVDADGFGMLTSALAVGALGGALLAASRRQASIALIVGAGGLYGVAMLVASLMPTYWSFASVVVVIGFASTIAMAVANGYVQTTADPATRGRVLALYLAVLMSGTPVGSLLAGWVTDEWGPRHAMAVGGWVGLTAFALGGAWLLVQQRGLSSPDSPPGPA